MEWISVEERLPQGSERTVSDDVLVYFPNAGENTYEIANYDYDLKRWVLITHGFKESLVKPSHWTRLPDAPRNVPNNSIAVNARHAVN